MSNECQPASFEVEPQGGPSDSFEVSELDKLLCARTNLIATTNGDERSKLILQHLIEVGEDGTAEIHCPVSICPVKYELTLENGGDTRRGDCAVIMAGISKQLEDEKSGKRPGMTFAEFAETPLGHKTIKYRVDCPGGAGASAKPVTGIKITPSQTKSMSNLILSKKLDRPRRSLGAE